MAFETELGPIIKKIDKQYHCIIEIISSRPASKNLQEIQLWIQEQIANKSLSSQIPLIAIVIDTIFQYLKKESDKDKTNFIENCLTNLIINWNNLSEEKIQEITDKLKEYNSTNDKEAQGVLTEFIGNSSESTTLLRDISRKLVLTCEKSLSSLSNPFRTELKNTPSAIDLATETGVSPAPFFKSSSPKLFANNLDKCKKKNKTRIIDFDEDGVGYDISSPYLYLKEVKRLSDINLDIELSTKIKKKLLLEDFLNQELVRLGRIENHEPDIKKIERKIKIYEFDLFANKEEKVIRQHNIEQKKKKTQKDRERRKTSKALIPEILPILKKINIYKKRFNLHSLSIDPFLFKECDSGFFTTFLQTINYEKFNQLINSAEYIIISINKIRKTLKKIDDFSESLGISSKYEICLNNYYRLLKVNFNKESIGNFLENALILFEQRALAFDVNYCLMNTSTLRNKILFSEPAFLDNFISSHNNKQIYKILADGIRQFLNKKRDNQISARDLTFKSYKNSIKNFFYLFTEEYYLSNKKIKKKFNKRIFLIFSPPTSIGEMKAALINLRWWQFFLLHVGVIFLLKRGFRDRLSQELFLDLLEEKFQEIDEKKEPNAENIDKLYGIKNHINSLKCKIQDRSIDLNSLNLLDSRQGIVDKLKSHKEIKHLLDNIIELSDQASSCVNQFNNLKNACSRESEKNPEGDEIFQFDKNALSKVQFPLKFR